jgi:hypothetical protein
VKALNTFASSLSIVADKTIQDTLLTVEAYEQVSSSSRKKIKL